MIGKRFASYLTIFLVLLFLRTDADGQEKQSGRETTGSFVAHNGKGIVQANGNCRQTIIVRITEDGKRRQEADYIVLRQEGDCVKGISEQKLNSTQQWRFSLIRVVNCDETLDSLMYLRQHGPTGEEMPKIELLWFLPGVEVEKISADRKLRCYFLGSAGFEPSSNPARR